jgi:hypothetical protein
VQIDKCKWLWILRRGCYVRITQNCGQVALHGKRLSKHEKLGNYHFFRVDYPHTVTTYQDMIRLRILMGKSHAWLTH